MPPLTATRSTLYASLSTMHNLYGHIILDPSLDNSYSFSFIGQTLEEAIKKGSYKVKQPTDADWGYVFRAEFNGKDFDISIISLSNGSYAVAIEQPRGSIEIFQRESIMESLLKAKEIVVNSLNAMVKPSSLNWYTLKEWRRSFDKDFWEP